MKRVKEFESNKDTIMTAFKTLLSDINKACGSPWEFEIIDVSSQAGVDTKGSVQLAIIDANAPEIKQEPFEFKATPGNGGFCRDIKLELKMTDAITLDKLLEKHNIQKIDFFSLDVEGYEISVLNGFDIEKYLPTYMLIETTSFENRRKVIFDYMQDRNYKVIEELTINDYLFTLK